jgi:hypothetical protein
MRSNATNKALDGRPLTALLFGVGGLRGVLFFTHDLRASIRGASAQRSAELKNQMTYQTYIKQVGLEEISCEEARAVGLLVIGLTYQCSKFWVSQDRQQGLALDPIHKKFYLWYAAFQPHRSDWLDADAEYQ